jgi:hypothetical protein
VRRGSGRRRSWLKQRWGGGGNTMLPGVQPELVMLSPWGCWVTCAYPLLLHTAAQAATPYVDQNSLRAAMATSFDPDQLQRVLYFMLRLAVGIEKGEGGAHTQGGAWNAGCSQRGSPGPGSESVTDEDLHLPFFFFGMLVVCKPCPALLYPSAPACLTVTASPAQASLPACMCIIITQAHRLPESGRCRVPDGRHPGAAAG